jgi:hypothetical protein
MLVDKDRAYFLWDCLACSQHTSLTITTIKNFIVLALEMAKVHADANVMKLFALGQ